MPVKPHTHRPLPQRTARHQAQVWTNGDLFNDDQACRGKLRAIAKLQPKGKP